MAGYNHKYHMSNNAVDAYEMGAKPYDQWTAFDMINEVNKMYDPVQHNFDINLLAEMPDEVIRMCVLSFSSWHHTTRKYKETDFYFVDGKKLSLLSNKDIKKYQEYVTNKE